MSVDENREDYGSSERGNNRGGGYRASVRGNYNDTEDSNGNSNSAPVDQGYRARGRDGGNNSAMMRRRPNNSLKKKGCPIESGVIVVNYKDSRTLQKFTSERGKVLPRRISSVSARGQRRLAVAIKRARYLALLPYVAK